VMAEGYELVIGSKQFIAGFEEQMVGMKRGESREIKVKFPENYQSKDLAGKDAIFNVTLDSFKRKREAKLDADMIKRIFPSEENPDEKIGREHYKGIQGLGRKLEGKASIGRIITPRKPRNLKALEFY